MLRGFCECRRVQFELDGEINDFSHCHCSQCRRLHGAAYATFAGVARDQFRYVSREDAIKSYASSESHDRIFCGECGSNIMVALDDEPENLYLSMSTLEGDPPRPSRLPHLCRIEGSLARDKRRSCTIRGRCAGVMFRSTRRIRGRSRADLIGFSNLTRNH